MGLLPEFVRRSKKSIRSLHPTASIAAYGKHANELVSTHHLSHYACDENSPMYKMMKYNAKIIGLGEKTVSMSFVHCIEDVMKKDFPVNIYYPDPFKTKYKDFEGKIRDMEVYVHHPNNQFNNIPGFTRKNISKKACQQNRIKGRNFFVAQSTLLFKEMMDLAKANKTIYN
jgi:aminoglycoside N3'-acetyltransferase